MKINFKKVLTNRKRRGIIIKQSQKHAGMAELADALDLGSSGCIHASSSLVTRTKKEYAGVVELADTYDSGSYAVTSMQVQVLSPAPSTLSRMVGSFCFFKIFFDI